MSRFIGLAVILAACEFAVPAPECDPGSVERRTVLSCERAVMVATAALESEHASIERIQFLYGSAIPCCSHLYRSEDEAPVTGYVVFTFADGRREHVDISVQAGETTVGSALPYGVPRD